MKLSFKKLNQKGFDHVVGLLGFIVVFAGIGTYLVVASHAATATYVELTLNGNKSACLSQSSISTCSSSDADVWFVKPKPGSSNFTLKNKLGQCMDDPAHSWQPTSKPGAPNRVRAVASSCNNSTYQQWNWVGVGRHELANRGTNNQGCLNSAANISTPGNPVIVYACKPDTWNEHWYEVTSAQAVNPKPWGLLGTTTQSSTNTGKVTFTSSVKNTVGPAATGTFRYGPRYFYSSTATPVRNSGGGYTGEVASVNGDKSYTGLKARSSINNITQTVTVPSGEQAAYICGTVYFSPQNWNTNMSGRSNAVCVSVPKLLGTAQ